MNLRSCVTASAVVVLSGIAAASPTFSGVAGVNLSAGNVLSAPISLEEGDIFNAMTAPVGTLFSSPDTLMRLVDPSGAEVVFNDDGGSGNGPSSQFGSTIRAAIRVSGVYTLQITGFNDRSFTGAHPEAGPLIFTGSVLGSTPGDFADSASDNTAAGAVPTGLGVGAAVGFGTLTAGDVDYFAVTMGAGDVLSAMTTGLQSQSLDTLLGVLDASGLLLNNDDAGGDSRGSNFESSLRFVAPAAGTYYIAVTGYGDSDFNGSGHTEDGAYGLTLSVVPAPGAAALLGLGMLAAGRRRR